MPAAKAEIARGARGQFGDERLARVDVHEHAIGDRLAAARGQLPGQIAGMIWKTSQRGGEMGRIQCAALAAALLLLGAGCREEGPAERAGRAIDDAAHEAGDSLRELTGEEGVLERAGRQADETLERMKRAVEER